MTIAGGLDADRGHWYSPDAVADLIATERAACAALCEEVVTHPAGYGGQWEGYGPVKTQRDGKECAAAIRERSNDRVEGRAAASSRRVPSHDGLCGNGNYNERTDK